MRLGVSLKTRPRSMGWLRLAPRASGNCRHKSLVYLDLWTQRITSAGELGPKVAAAKAAGNSLQAIANSLDADQQKVF